MLAQGCDSTDKAEEGLYKNDWGSIFPSVFLLNLPAFGNGQHAKIWTK